MTGFFVFYFRCAARLVCLLLPRRSPLRVFFLCLCCVFIPCASLLFSGVFGCLSAGVFGNTECPLFALGGCVSCGFLLFCDINVTWCPHFLYIFSTSNSYVHLRFRGAGLQVSRREPGCQISEDKLHVFTHTLRNKHNSFGCCANSLHFL